MREAQLSRKTKETDVQVHINLDGSGKYDNQTGVGFLDHMLDALAKQGKFDLEIRCSGDLQVDAHHTVEDVGIVLGQAFAKALGDGGGIQRYGFMALPMDEAVVLTSIDISGRSYLNYDVQIPAAKVGDFDTELVKEFFWGFTRQAGVTLHIKQLAGENSHHILECVFKSVGRALAQACAIDPALNGAIPSTKGVL